MNHNAPIFQSIFGKEWDSLPIVLKKHYANKAYSNDVVKLDGIMDITLSTLTRLLKPLFRLTGALVPYEGSNIPTIVYSKAATPQREAVFPVEAAFQRGVHRR